MKYLSSNDNLIAWCAAHGSHASMAYRFNIDAENAGFLTFSSKGEHSFFGESVSLKIGSNDYDHPLDVIYIGFGHPSFDGGFVLSTNKSTLVDHGFKHVELATLTTTTDNIDDYLIIYPGSNHPEFINRSAHYINKY